MSDSTERGVDARCPLCMAEADHHWLDLWQCPECERFWDTAGEVRAT